MEPDTFNRLIALEEEAKKRNMSYGELVNSTSDWERYEIVQEYVRKNGRKY